MSLPVLPQLNVIEAPTKPTIGFDMFPMVFEEMEKLYRVIILNDDKTTFEFVIISLITVFKIEPTRAEDIAWETHNVGEAYVATLPYAIYILFYGKFTLASHAS